jgi:hypothetical protein
MLFLKPSAARQKIGLAFLATSVVAGIVLSYVWAWHLTTPSVKFSTRWAVFNFSLGIWLVVAVVTTLLFVLPLCFVRRFAQPRTLVRDNAATVLLAAVVQTALFAAPALSEAFNPFLLFLFVLPLLASGAFLMVPRPTMSEESQVTQHDREPHLSTKEAER